MKLQDRNSFKKLEEANASLANHSIMLSKENKLLRNKVIELERLMAKDLNDKANKISEGAKQ